MKSFFHLFLEIALETELESSKKELLLAKRKGESISKTDAELRSQIESLQAELKETKEAAENSGETSQGLWNNGFL